MLQRLWTAAAGHVRPVIASNAASVAITAAATASSSPLWTGLRGYAIKAPPLHSESQAYFSLPKRDTYVPSPRGDIKEPADFLKRIGRNTESVATKFKDWDHLFTATTKEMGELGIKSQMRRYILGWREWYRRGVEPVAIELPKRQRKHLKRKALVKLARLQRKGLA
eukprot:jgi/Hompol1/1214/HPOL_001056-RA